LRESRISIILSGSMIVRMFPLVFLAALAVARSHSLAAESAPKPNILLITGDDLGFQLGCYGETAAHTPNMDRIAGEGIRFTRGYVTQASCSPSRSSILTGLYPHQNGQIGLAHLGYAMTDPNVPKLPNLLKSVGYFTGIIGKFHVAPPKWFAFDFSRLSYNETRKVGTVSVDFRALIAGTPPGQPWFAYVNYADPHHPHERDVAGHPKVKTDPAQIKFYPWLPKDHRTDQTRSELADFQTCVNRMDEDVGLLLQVLRETGHDRDTLIILLGDNGPPFPRAKVSSFEAGVNVPFLAWWPGRIKGGQVSDRLVCSIDILPTLLSLAGTEPPSNLPGRSLWPLLQGESVTWRETLATEYTSHDPPNFAPQRSLRDLRYKLTLTLLKDPTFKWPEGVSPKSFQKVQPKSAQGEFIELYDLQEDPYEFKNRAADPKLKDIRERLLKDLQKWREATSDPLLNADALREQILKHRNPPPTPVPDWKKTKKAAAGTPRCARSSCAC
jgi:N-sulfoglucosamine sulfohydrolase